MPEGTNCSIIKHAHNNQFVIQSKLVWISIKHAMQSEVFKKQAVIPLALKNKPPWYHISPRPQLSIT